MYNGKARAFWPLLFLLVFTDCATKRLAEMHLLEFAAPREVVGDVLRFTLAYNPGAAFGFAPLGESSRWLFAAVAVVMTALFFHWYQKAEPHDRQFATALGLISGGALGNLLDRLRSPRGVVDFIDIGVGDVRFWTFNLADVGLTVGAVILAVLLWRRESELDARRMAEARTES
jgi:signal peptidase II